MSVNWVMLDSTTQHSFITLPNERLLYQSPARTAFSLSTPSTYPGSRPISLNCSTGVAFLTNRRVVYIPTNRTPELESFACPILNLHDTHVSAPFFGPNVWTAGVQAVPGGGLPSTTGPVALKLVFKDGGAFDFYTLFERVKEKIANAREAGTTMENVHLEELPRYEDAGGQSSSDGVGRPVTEDEMLVVVAVDDGPGDMGLVEPEPSGPPPGYEETQRESVVAELERQIDRIERQALAGR